MPRSRKLFGAAVAAAAAACLLLTAQQQPPPPQQVKPAMQDTIRGSVYADNWFALYINGKLVTVDPIDFLPHNQVNLDILPEYPMTIAVLAKDNADPATGLEYGDHIGDAGLILRFADGTVTNGQWKAKAVFRGPVNNDVRNPEVEYLPVPEDWFLPGFDDSDWPLATEFTEQDVRPDGNYVRGDFNGARFIWSREIGVDNTVLFRYRAERPGWRARWNTRPELDNACALYPIPFACQSPAAAAAGRKEHR